MYGVIRLGTFNRHIITFSYSHSPSDIRDRYVRDEQVPSGSDGEIKALERRMESLEADNDQHEEKRKDVARQSAKAELGKAEDH